MLIYARYENGGWTVDESQAALIIEFRNLLQDDKLGSKVLAFVALYADPTSFLYEIYEKDEDRYKEAIRCVYGEAKVDTILKNKKVTDAISKYQRISNTASVKLRNQFQGAMKKVGDYIETQDVADDNVKKFMDTLKEFPDMIDKFSDMNKGKKEDTEDTKKIVRGGRELSYREKKKAKKR